MRSELPWELLYADDLTKIDITGRGDQWRIVGYRGPGARNYVGPSLCNSETQRLPAGGAGSPRRLYRWGLGQSPGGKRILATILGPNGSVVDPPVGETGAS